jgi:hypothetical protein
MLQRTRHADGVQSLPSVVAVGETFVHVDVAVSELQGEIGWVDRSRPGRVPAVGGELFSVADRIALIALAQRFAEEGARNLAARLLGVRLELARREERRRISGRIVEKRRIGLRHVHAAQDLERHHVVDQAYEDDVQRARQSMALHPSKRLLDYGEVGYPFHRAPTMATFVPDVS